MLLDGDKALAAFKKAKHVREEYLQYSLAGNHNVLSITDLIASVTRMYSISIEAYDVPFRGEYTRGMLLRYAHKAVIYVRREMDDDWKRFTVVKELCHLVLDEKEDWSTDGVKTIGDLRDDYQVFGALAAPTSHSEMFAEFAAIELMYPVSCRTTDLQRINDGAETLTKIAAYHGMPVSMVERALSSSYQNIASTVWDRLNTELKAAE